MEDSILNSTKNALGIAPDYTEFDVQIIMYINAVLSTLHELGVGPILGFSITNATATWSSFLNNDPRLNGVQTYVYLRVRLLFDPPATSFHIDAMKDQIKELEWRLEATRQMVPQIPAITVIDGGDAD